MAKPVAQQINFEVYRRGFAEPLRLHTDTLTCNCIAVFKTQSSYYTIPERKIVRKVSLDVIFK